MKELDWEILKALYEKNSMTKTAEALYISQPTLTKRIKAMEQEWGIEIVKRNSKGVIFTEDGRYLVQKANMMCDFLQEIKQHFAENSEKKDMIKIGVPNSFARIHMPKLLKSYSDGHDNLIIKTVPNTSDRLIHQLMEESLDASIICGDYGYLGDKVCLFSEQLYIVVQKGTKYNQIDKLPLIESYLNPMVQLIADQWWKTQFGSLPQSVQRVPYSDIAVEMVKSGLGVSLIFTGDNPWNDDSIELLPAYDRYGNPVSRNVWLMWSEKSYRSKEITEFILFIQEHFRKKENVNHDKAI